MNGEYQYVVFVLDELRIALHLSGVERVIWAAAVTPLPEAPVSVPGVINLGGRIMPVVDIRRRFGLPGREIEPEDRFIIAHTSRRMVALWVDGVDGVVEPAAEEVTQAADILPDMGYVDGVIELPDEVILIHNLDRFLSMEEERILEGAMEGEAS